MVVSGLFFHVLVTLLIVKNGHGLRKFYLEDDCSGSAVIDMQEESTPAGRLLVTRMAKYRKALSCSVTIQTRPDKHILVVFRLMDIEWEAQCDDDYVSLHDGPSTKSPVVAGAHPRFCGNRVPTGSFASSGNILTVYFQSDVYKQNDGFEIVFTEFRKAKSCYVDEMKCSNGRCIAMALQCNNYDNCGDNSDECHVNTEVLAAIIISVFLLTIVGVGITMVGRRKSRLREIKKNRNLKKAIQHVTKKGKNEIEIHPCEICSVRIVKAQRNKPVRTFTRRVQGVDQEQQTDGAENEAGATEGNENETETAGIYENKMAELGETLRDWSRDVDNDEQEQPSFKFDLELDEQLDDAEHAMWSKCERVKNEAHLRPTNGAGSGNTFQSEQEAELRQTCRGFDNEAMDGREDCCEIVLGNHGVHPQVRYSDLGHRNSI